MTRTPQPDKRMRACIKKTCTLREHTKKLNLKWTPKEVTKEEGIPDGWEGMDCGPKSMELFREKILDG